MYILLYVKQGKRSSDVEVETKKISNYTHAMRKKREGLNGNGFHGIDASKAQMMVNKSFGCIFFFSFFISLYSGQTRNIHKITRWVTLVRKTWDSSAKIVVHRKLWSWKTSVTEWNSRMSLKFLQFFFVTEWKFSTSLSFFLNFNLFITWQGRKHCCYSRWYQISYVC